MIASIRRCIHFIKNKYRRFWVLFFNASVFLTRFPAPKWVPFHNRLLQLSALHFPLVGLVLGIFGVLLFLLLSSFFSVELSVLLMVLAGIYATGAFHEDGWADYCDAIGGGYDKEGVLRIMKDSRLGTYGTVGLIGILAVKLMTLIELAKTDIVLLCSMYILAQGMSRWFALTVMSRLTYVRDNFGKSKPLANNIPFRRLCIAAGPVAVAALVVTFLSPMTFAVLILTALGAYGAVLILSRQLQRAIGGYTGDGLGAVQQLSEVVLYLSLLGLLSL